MAKKKQNKKTNKTVVKPSITESPIAKAVIKEVAAKLEMEEEIKPFKVIPQESFESIKPIESAPVIEPITVEFVKEDNKVISFFKKILGFKK